MNPSQTSELGSRFDRLCRESMTMRRIARILLAAALLVIAAYCVFGLLATFEPPGFLGMRVGYGIGSVACLGGAAWTLFAKPRGI